MKEAKVSFTSGSTTSDIPIPLESRMALASEYFMPNREGTGIGVPSSPLPTTRSTALPQGILVPGVMALPKLLFQYRSFHEIGLVDRIAQFKVTSVEYI